MSWLASGLIMANKKLKDSADDDDAKEEVENYAKREITAEWRVPLKGKLYKIEFEHGTASGKRVLWIDEKEIFRRDWMFKLVGDDVFHVEGVRCVIRVDPAPGFRYSYSLYVDGKPLAQFKERQAKALKIWEANILDKLYRIVLEKDTLNIFLNGIRREEEPDFVDGGTEVQFIEDGNVFVLNARASGNRHDGIVHTLKINARNIDAIPIQC